MSKINQIEVENITYDIEDSEVKSWARQNEKPTYQYSEIQNTPDLSHFITNTVDNLTNYYLKNETYTKTEVQNLISAIQQFHYEIVQELPTTGETNIIYLVPKAQSQTNNYYDEYVYANGWEKIGDTEIDLSNYVTTTQLNSALSNYTTTNDLTTLLNTKEDKTNKVTSITSTSTNTEYASAKAVWDLVSAEIGNINTILATLTTPGGNE